MVILVVFNSFNVVKNLKKPDSVAHQKPPFYTTYMEVQETNIKRQMKSFHRITKVGMIFIEFFSKHTKLKFHRFFVVSKKIFGGGLIFILPPPPAPYSE